MKKLVALYLGIYYVSYNILDKFLTLKINIVIIHRLQDWRCLWCKATVHTACRPAISIKCPLGPAKLSVVPPTALHSIGNYDDRFYCTNDNRALNNEGFIFCGISNRIVQTTCCHLPCLQIAYNYYSKL